MKNKFMCLLVGVLLVVSLMSFASAMTVPTTVKPHIRDFAYDETRVVFRPLLSILVDKETINLGESATFTISLTTTAPDSDYTDGTYQVQYAGWVFADKDGNMVKSKEFMRVYGSFSDTVIVTPTTIGEYALVGLIIQYDQTYDSTTSSWITSPEEVKVKGAKKLIVTKIDVYRFQNDVCTKTSILTTERTTNDYDTLAECQEKIIGPPPTPQTPGIIGWLGNIWQSIIDWFSGLFGG